MIHGPTGVTVNAAPATTSTTTATNPATASGTAATANSSDAQVRREYRSTRGHRGMITLLGYHLGPVHNSLAVTRSCSRTRSRITTSAMAWSANDTQA